VITDVADNTTIVGVPARIKLRGGRPREFFSALGKPKAPPKQVGANGSKPSDLAATGPKSG
jgi:serine acetyltransferase